MPVPFQYPNVNWVNGMKIRKEHFIQQENAFEDKLKDVAACFLSSNNYGILPLGADSAGSFKVLFQAGNQNRLDVSVLQLRAITPAGARIEILEDQRSQSFSLAIDDEIAVAKKGDSTDFYVLLTVDLFNRKPFGNPNPDEEPPRYPYTEPTYKVHLIPEAGISAQSAYPYSLVIGKTSFKPGAIDVIEDYIPACTCLNSHQKLIDFRLLVEKFFNQLELNLVSIIRKIREKGHDSTLSESVLRLAENLISFTNTNNLKIRWQLPHLAPVYLFENIASFARIIRNTIDCNSAAQKEEMLNYFTNWSELKQGEFERLLVQCINFEYNHNEIHGSVSEFSEFVQIINSLFEKLESLAYIGKKKETNIFVKEQSPGSKRSFLLD
jgi:hypothetical protein